MKLSKESGLCYPAEHQMLKDTNTLYAALLSYAIKIIPAIIKHTPIKLLAEMDSPNTNTAHIKENTTTEPLQKKADESGMYLRETCHKTE